MHRSMTIIALATISLGACGGGDGDAAMSASALASAFRDQGAPADEAECMGEALGGKFSKADIDTFFSEGDPDEVAAGLLDAFTDALMDCLG